MKLKKAILSILGRDTLRAIADGLEVDGVDRRSVTELAAALSRSRRATAEAILDFLSEAEVKAACDEFGVSATGRRAALIESLLQSEEQATAARRKNGSRAASRSRTSHEENDGMDDADLRVSQPEPIRLPDPPPGMMRVTRTELVWPGKYNDNGTRKEVPRVSLPFQVIETINESRATREAKKERQPTLFDIWEADEGETFEDGWTNKLIWGDNLLVMGSLLAKLSGKVDLVYIDPPFATGADFSFDTVLGDEEITKEPSIIEEKAYRDTWGRGLSSFLQTLFDRFRLIYELLSDEGSLYVHLEPDIGNHVRPILDEVFGTSGLRTEIAWKRTSSHGNVSRTFGEIWECIYYYTKSADKWTWNQVRVTSLL